MVKISNFSITQNPISTTNNQGSLPGLFCRQHCNVLMTLNSKKAGQGLGFWSLRKFAWFHLLGFHGWEWCVPAWGCNYMPFDHSRMWSDIFYIHMVDDRFSLKWSVPSTSHGPWWYACVYSVLSRLHISGLREHISGWGYILMTCSHCWRWWNTSYIYKEDLLWVWPGCGVSIISTNRGSSFYTKHFTLRS